MAANEQQPPSAREASGNATHTTLRTLPQQLMPKVDELLQRRWARAALLSLFVIPLAFLLGPSFSQSTANLASQLKVGERADANIKATRDFDYQPTKEQVEKQRLAAAKASLPVFDHHTDQGAILLSRITGAFRAMTAALAAEQKREDAAKQPKPVPASAPERKAGGRNVAPRKNVRKPARVKLAKAKPVPAKTAVKTLVAPKLDLEALRKRFANLLQTEVSQATFERLYKARFSGDVRSAIALLVGPAMDLIVISHRGALQPFLGKPITVRHLVGGRAGSRGEEKISNFNRIRDLQQIKEQIRHQINVHGAKLGAELRKAVVELVEGYVVPNLAFNPAETARRKDLAREAIKVRPLHYVRGQVLIRDGEPITKDDVRVVAAMLRTYEGVNIFQVIVGIGLFALIVLVTVFLFGTNQFKRFTMTPRDLLMMGAVLIGMMALTRGVVGLVGAKHLGIARYLLPVAGGAMLVRLLVTAEAAALFAVVASGFSGLLVERSLGLTLFYLVTSLAASYGVLQVQSRSAVLRAGLMAGLLGGATVFCLQLFGGQLVFKTLVLSSLAAVAGGLLAAFTALALLPAIEWVFAYTTDISLLELANLNHPLLRELMLRAPGTYHHSMVVGNLAEAGCEAIGANGLLARVAAYYHDVGKMKNAAYFAENFRSGENPHNRLKPSMSSLIIRSHVKDGIEMMREHGIPEPVIETASQHHGTALIAFFYHKALEAKDDEEDILEADYRYPGPKPQSREAGVIMVADGVEAAARSLGEPTDDRLQAVVQRIINTQFTDGQLDHCDLTLRDLHLIAKSFLQVLSGIYHARPTYPWQRQETRGRKRETTRHKAAERPRTQENPAIPEGGAEVEAKADPTPARGNRGRKGDANGKAATQPKKEAPLKRVATAPNDQRELDGEGPGEAAGKSGDAGEAAPESSPDIKRLGLN